MGYNISSFGIIFVKVFEKLWMTRHVLDIKLQIGWDIIYAAYNNRELGGNWTDYLHI
jgi:hypothetical protein